MGTDHNDHRERERDKSFGNSEGNYTPTETATAPTAILAT
jgi:hypothetical protein